MSELKIKPNENKDIVAHIRQGLKETGGYCPCLVERNADTKCQCKAFREQTTEGSCLCGLFVKYAP